MLAALGMALQHLAAHLLTQLFPAVHFGLPGGMRGIEFRFSADRFQAVFSGGPNSVGIILARLVQLVLRGLDILIGGLDRGVILSPDAQARQT